MRKVIDWLQGKKAYIVAALMGLKGIFEFEMPEEDVVGLLDSLIRMLDSINSLLAGAGLAAIRAAISKMGK